MQVLSIENVTELSAVPKQHDVYVHTLVRVYICSETNCEKTYSPGGVFEAKQFRQC
jgi:hypothetical protein